ncbi:hypothetical protein Dimus_038944 [Dionaea muscipula]
MVSSHVIFIKNKSPDQIRNLRSVCLYSPHTLYFFYSLSLSRLSSSSLPRFFSFSLSVSTSLSLRTKSTATESARPATSARDGRRRRGVAAGWRAAAVSGAERRSTRRREKRSILTTGVPEPESDEGKLKSTLI